jgi:small subunit ribosomal protein S19e
MNKQQLVERTAKKLDGIIKMPEWANFVKTGVAKERPPSQPNWWYLRAASILHQVEDKGPIGVSKLRTLYGSNKNRGVKPEEYRRASGKIIRTLLQQLEKAELIKQHAIGVHKGRVVTAKGKALLGE